MATAKKQFQWTTDWTKSFIHIRLQNINLFKLNKHPWKDLHNIMMDNGFPKTITVEQIRIKWYYIFKAYQKAVAKNNINFTYYDIIFNYLGNNSNDTFENWTDDWIRKLIEVRIKNNHIFASDKIEQNDCWTIVSSELKSDGVSIDFSVQNIQMIWESLISTFKIKHTYKDRLGMSNVWEFYNSMLEYVEKCNPGILDNLKIIKNFSLKAMDTNEVDIKDNTVCIDDFVYKPEDPSPSKNIKTEYNFDSKSCRACLGHSEKMIAIDDNLTSMMMTCADIQMCSSDNLPQNLCQSCFAELNIAFKFKNRCEESDSYMKAICVQQQDDVLNLKENADQSIDEMNANSSDNMDYSSDIDIKEDQPNMKKKLPKCSKKIKSKNYILSPIVDSFGTTVHKKRYVYLKVCEICGKATQGMKKHMASHSDAKMYTCTKCPKTFKYMASLQTHLLTHNTTPLKVCQICGKKFFRNLLYKRHLVYHDNKRKFKCDKCGKTFNTSDILKVHYRSHTGERPYSCKVCGKSFFSRGCVSRHQKVHKKKTVQSS